MNHCLCKSFCALFLPQCALPYPLLHCKAVKSIKKQHLVEVKSLANPPAAVKLAVESICVLLGEGEPDWKQLRGIIMRENFISTIVNFKTDDITWVLSAGPSYLQFPLVHSTHCWTIQCDLCVSVLWNLLWKCLGTWVRSVFPGLVGQCMWWLSSWLFHSRLHNVCAFPSWMLLQHTTPTQICLGKRKQKNITGRQVRAKPRRRWGIVQWCWSWCWPGAAVKSIKKKDLVEIRSMGNPPPVVKLALEAICLLLGENASDWKVIRAVIMKDSFISSIVSYKTDDITWVGAAGQHRPWTWV